MLFDFTMAMINFFDFKTIDFNHDNNISNNITTYPSLGLSKIFLFINDITNNYVSSFFNYLVYFLNILSILYIIVFVISFIIKFTNYHLYLFLCRQIFFFLTILEKEISNLNILTKLLSIFILFMVIYNIDFFFSETLPIILVLSFYLLLLLITIVLLIPVYLIYNYGVYFLSYIRGASLKKNLFFELLVDCLNLISYFLRINIQFIRIMLINFMFFMYEESYYEVIYPWYNTTSLDYNLYNFTDYLDYGLNYFMVYFAQWLYEITHFWVIFFMQSTVFALIITLLVQFLYTLYLIKHMQLFFKDLKSRKNK